MKTLLSIILSGYLSVASAQLVVTVSPPVTAGSKAVVKLGMKNDFTEKIESARAVVFLVDQDGKMVGQSTRWVIGGRADEKGMAPGATNVFNFVVFANSRFRSTNLEAKVSFNRVVLDGGKMADVAKQVTVRTATK